MSELTKAVLEEYKRDIVAFAEKEFYIENGQPIKLFPSQKTFLGHLFSQDTTGKWISDTGIYSAPKKTGKSSIAGLTAKHVAITQEPFSEIYIAANDLEQSTSRVFEIIARSIRLNPNIQADITTREIYFPATGTKIIALPNDWRGTAGINPTFVVVDEPAGIIHESGYRFFEELAQSPARKNSMHFLTGTAGFIGESIMFERLYKRGLAGERIDDELPIYRNGKLLMLWDHQGRAPWQTKEYYQAQRQVLRPNTYLRLHENRWVATDQAFIDPSWFDACVDPTHTMSLRDEEHPIFVGVDIGVKRDNLAVVGTWYDRESKRVVLAFHRQWEPKPGHPLDLEETFENYLLEQAERFLIAEVRYDPYGMQRSAPTLQKAGLRMREYTQSIEHLTAMGDCLYSLLKERRLVGYESEEIKLALSRAVAVEGARGWKITKARAAHKIDLVIALAMSALAAVQRGGRRRQPPLCIVTERW